MYVERAERFCGAGSIADGYRTSSMSFAMLSPLENNKERRIPRVFTRSFLQRVP